MMLDTLLTEKEAAEYLRLTPETLRNWRYLRQGPAPTILGGRTIRYKATALAAFINSEGPA